MSEIRIESIQIENFRSFGEKQEFQFPNEDYQKPVAIIGYNNAGKTNLINAIKLGLYEYVSDEKFSLYDFHHCDIKRLPKIITKYKYVNSIIPQAGFAENKTNDLEFTDYQQITDETDGRNSIKNNIRKSELIYSLNFHKIKEEISLQKSGWGKMKSFLAKHMKHLISTDEVLKTQQNSFKDKVSDATDEVLKTSKLEGFIGRISHYYKKNLRNDKIKISFEMPEYEDIFLSMLFKIGINESDDNLLPIENFGDGHISLFVMSVIQAIADKNSDDKCIFIFEEPECFLHSNHQEYFYKEILCGLAKNGHQVIYSTHSDKMIDAFNTKSIIRLEFYKDKKQTIKTYNEVGEFSPSVIQISEETTEEKITIENFNSFIKSVEPNLNKMLFSRKVILLEGPNDLLVYKYFIEREVESITGNKDFAGTYLSFLNIAFLVHHGKSTAYLLIELCKHFKLDFFVINDLDDNERTIVEELQKFSDESELKSSDLYLKKNSEERSSSSKGNISVNWKLISTTTPERLHFNIPDLEGVINYVSRDKNSFKILNLIQSIGTSPVNLLLPTKLKTYLEFDTLTEM
ncbi:MAG: putative ATP-dependent endonuclease of OLD family [Flammeovirgaceae bacterium]|jgi:putative ATP-dependent endonuclease of OLD family